MGVAEDKKIEKLIGDLFSPKHEVVESAIKEIPKKGNARIVLPMLRAHKAWAQDRVLQAEIEKVLKEMKDEKAIPELISALEDVEFEQERGLILSIFWNAGLFPVDYIPVLIKQAIKGDYLVSLEALTVIENIEAQIDQEIWENASDDLDYFLNEHGDEPHADLVYELKQVISSRLNA